MIFDLGFGFFFICRNPRGGYFVQYIVIGVELTIVFGWFKYQFWLITPMLYAVEYCGC